MKKTLVFLWILFGLITSVAVFRHFGFKESGQIDPVPITKPVASSSLAPSSVSASQSSVVVPLKKPLDISLGVFIGMVLLAVIAWVVFKQEDEGGTASSTTVARTETRWQRSRKRVKDWLDRETRLDMVWGRLVVAVIAYGLLILAISISPPLQPFWNGWRADSAFFFLTLIGFPVTIGGLVLARKGKNKDGKEVEANKVLGFFMSLLLSVLIISVSLKLWEADVPEKIISFFRSSEPPSPTRPPAAAVLMPEMTPSGPVTLNICAPADCWSNAIVIPPGCHWGIHPRGLIRVRNLRGKEWDDGPGMMTPNIKLGNTVLDRTLSFISREKDQPVQVEVTYEPS